MYKRVKCLLRVEVATVVSHAQYRTMLGGYCEQKLCTCTSNANAAAAVWQMIASNTIALHPHAAGQYTNNSQCIVYMTCTCSGEYEVS